ncbi:hypothetical protein ACWCV9_23830 [Streptomyces sp. NPDC001606]
MFNGTTLPEKDQLLDLVAYLNGDPQEWSRRLANAVAAEERWNLGTDSRTASTAELEALKAEIEGYRLIASDPESIFAQATRMQEDAQKRINAALEVEAHLRVAIAAIERQLDEAKAGVPLAQEKAQEVINQARATARRIEYDAHTEAKTRLAEANEAARNLIARAEAEASRIIDQAGTESRRVRADAGRIVDQLLLEGDQYLEEARVDRLQGELERQRGEALVERMKLRAKIDLAQVIMQAQQKLADVGATEDSALLDILLQDLGINELTIGSEETRGRHRKVASQSSSGDTRPTGLKSEAFNNDFVMHDVKPKAALPHRRKAPSNVTKDSQH